MYSTGLSDSRLLGVVLLGVLTVPFLPQRPVFLCRRFMGLSVDIELQLAGVGILGNKIEIPIFQEGFIRIKGCVNRLFRWRTNRACGESLILIGVIGGIAGNVLRRQYNAFNP